MASVKSAVEWHELGGWKALLGAWSAVCRAGGKWRCAGSYECPLALPGKESPREERDEPGVSAGVLPVKARWESSENMCPMLPAGLIQINPHCLKQQSLRLLP